MLHLLKLIKAIHNLKKAFYECDLENHPKRMLAMLVKDRKKFKASGLFLFKPLWSGSILVIMRSILEFLDIELMFRLTFLDYRPRFQEQNECSRFREMIKNASGFPKWEIKSGSEKHQICFHYDTICVYEKNYCPVYDDYKPIGVGEPPWYVSLVSEHFWDFFRLLDSPDRMKKYAEDLFKWTNTPLPPPGMMRKVSKKNVSFLESFAS